MGHVIFLSSISRSDSFEHYGYWTGKNYKVQGELYPVTDSQITERTKIYSTEARAKRALESCLDRPYVYVTNGRIEPVVNHVN